MIGKIWSRARVVGLLRLPGDDPALDINLPGAGAGAVGAVRRAYDLVVLPTLAITVLPAAILVRGDAVAVGKLTINALEEAEAVKKMAHVRSHSFSWLYERRPRTPVGVLAALDISEQPATARVEPPGDSDAGEIEDEEGPQRRLGSTGKTERGAVALGDEKGAVSCDRRCEADDCRSFLFRLPGACGGIGRRHQALHLRAHDRGYHLEG